MNEEPTSLVDPYHLIAELYDVEHDTFRDDIDLLLTFADIVGDPILEMGCGSGRILVPLAEAGFNVVGLDRSATMLDRARSRMANAGVSDRVTLFQGDLVDALSAPKGPFGLVIYSLNALMHLSSPESQLESLRNARKSLDPRGQIIIDVVNPTPDYLVSLGAAPALEGSWRMVDGSVVDKWSFRKIDASRQIIDTTLWYDQVQDSGVLIRHRSRFVLRYLHFNELRLMLGNAGFTEIRVYGSYEMDPFEDASDRMFITADVTPADVQIFGTD
jgi:SAM-dependent methyltransferase